MASEEKHYLSNGADTAAAPAEALEFGRSTQAKMVDLKFTDLLGAWQHMSLPLSAFDESAFDEGLGFDGSSIRGWQGISESDMLLVPQADTAILDPFTETPTLSILCEILDPVTREPYSKDPRRIARRAEEYLRSTGVADTSYFGPESEFFVFDSVAYDMQVNGAKYEVDSAEGDWNSGKPGLGDNGSGMHCHQSLWKEGATLMADPSGYAGLSQLARNYVGGLLAHAPALLAFCAPTTNSYRRLVPGYEAPVNLVYSQRNRS